MSQIEKLLAALNANIVRAFPEPRAGGKQVDLDLRTEELRFVKLSNTALFTTQREEPEPIRLPGSVIGYLPEGSAYDVAVEVAFGESRAWIRLHPGVPLVYKPLGFRNVRFRFTKLNGSVLSIAANTNLGKLLISHNIEGWYLGANPAAAMYTRDLPSLNTANTTTLTSIGALGIFSFRATVPGTIDGRVVRIDYELTCPSNTPEIYIGFGTAIIVDNGSNRSMLRKINPGETIRFTRAGRPANPDTASPAPTDDDASIYGEFADCAFAAIRREYFIS